MIDVKGFDWAFVPYTVLDTDNLQFSEEFLEFPARADTDICADTLGFSARYRTEESRQEFRADSCGNWRKPLVVKSLVKLSQFCYGFKDIRKYRKSSVDACDKMADHRIEPQR